MAAANLGRAVALAAALMAADVAAQGRFVSAPENLARIAIGTTTAKQVEELLGAPYNKQRDTRRGLDSWEYRLWNYGDEEILWISLSADGVVREVIKTRRRQSLS